jgi:hypothetical protein
MKTLQAIMMVGLGTIIGAACGGAQTPPPASGPPAPVAVDNGQPKMEAALVALQRAQSEVNAAEPNKGGHREKALMLIQRAIEAVNAGREYAAAHPEEVGAAEGPAAPEPVDEEVAGAANQPRMHAGIVALREARRQLREAKHDKGGHRVQALELIQQAIEQLKEGVRFANMH